MQAELTNHKIVNDVGVGNWCQIVKDDEVVAWPCDVLSVSFKDIDDFDETMMPIENEAEGEGVYHFETYGDDLEKVKAANPETVWTVIDGDDGELRVSQGFQLENRVHYILTKVPAPWPVEDFLYV